MRGSPRHRHDEIYRAWQAQASLPEKFAGHPVAESLFNIFLRSRKTQEPDEVTVHAYELFTDLRHRGYMDAFLLAGGDADTIQRVFDVPMEVTEAYEYAFFDKSVFRNRMEKLSFAANYEEANSTDRWGGELVRSGLTTGLDYLIWTFGGATVMDLDVRHSIRTAMVDAFYKSRLHLGNAVTSEVSKEAQKWLNVATKNAELLEKLDPKVAAQAHEALRVALTQSDDTVVEEVKPDDILR